MNESIDKSMERIIELCAQLEREAFSIPPPNPVVTRLVSLSIYIRNLAENVQAENFAAGEQWTPEEVARLQGPAATPPSTVVPGVGK